MQMTTVDEANAAATAEASWPGNEAGGSNPSTPPPRILRLGWPSVLMVFGFWSLWGLLMGAGLYFSPTRQALSAPLELIAISLLEGYIWAALTFPLFALVERIDLTAEGWAPRVAALVAGGLVLAFAVAWIVPVIGGLFLFEFSDGYFSEPPRSASAFTHLLNHALLASLLVLATGAARSYMLRYQARQEEAARLRAQLAESRLQSLRMQLNPHFLFNTMNTIAALVAEDPKGVRTMIARLSGLLRDTLDGAAEIPVSREITMVERYLGIVAVRFEGRLETQVTLDPSVANALVPNFILQPLVENAVNYAVVPNREPTHIRVDVRRVNDELALSVVDDGPGVEAGRADRRSKRPQSSGLGLAHIRERLSAMYGEAAQLTMSEPPGGGTAAEIRMPLRFAPDDPTQSASGTRPSRVLATTHG